MSTPLALFMFPESFKQAKSGDFGESSIGAGPPMNARIPQLPGNDAAEHCFGQEPTSLRRIARDGAPVGLDHHGREITFGEPLQFALKTTAALRQRGKQIGQGFPLDCHAVLKTFHGIIACGKTTVRGGYKQRTSTIASVGSKVSKREWQLLSRINDDYERNSQRVLS
jgi:hypothetical protein